MKQHVSTDRPKKNSVKPTDQGDKFYTVPNTGVQPLPWLDEHLTAAMVASVAAASNFKPNREPFSEEKNAEKNGCSPTVWRVATGAWSILPGKRSRRGRLEANSRWNTPNLEAGRKKEGRTP